MKAETERPSKPTNRKVLVIGSGGREHALAWTLGRSPKVAEVMVAPGNPGTASEGGKIRNVDVGASNEALADFAAQEAVDLTIVGPEAPLVAGIRDHFDERGLRCFAPSQAAAQLEGSKSFAKRFMARHDIPTAASETFTDADEAERYIRRQGVPIVVKADGLAAGKGVVVARSDVEEAVAAARAMLAGERFGEAGRTVVVEQFLEGEEASFTCVCDGDYALPLASSQDHKPRDDSDQGPNTGGMGAYSPAPVVTPAVHERIIEEVVKPTLRGMAAEGSPFQGFLYCGLMVAPDGAVNVVEFNCRFGDPEAQPVLMRLRSDLSDLCLRALDGNLSNATLDWDERAALGVVLASGGYPLDYQTGHPISGLGDEMPDAKVFHAGTAFQDDTVVTAGGRVLCVVGLGRDVADAQRQAYSQVRKLHWPAMHYRTDIGFRAIEKGDG